MNRYQLAAGYAGLLLLRSAIVEAGPQPAPPAPSAQGCIIVTEWINQSAAHDMGPMGAALCDLLVSILSEGTNLCVVDRERLKQVLGEQTLQRVAGGKESLTSAQGRLLGARHLCTGSYALTDGDLTLHVRIVDIESSAVLAAHEVRGSVETLDVLCRRAAGLVAQAASGAPASPSFDRVDLSPMAGAHFARGLGLYWSGNRGGAASEFIAALRSNARHAEARYWLGKAFAAAGMRADASAEFQRFVKDFPRHALRGDAERQIEECRRHIGSPMVQALTTADGHSLTDANSEW